ncbi:MAG: HvfC/BufC N-terminal domain-containing protein [Gammaproteobacteria bacterium]
MNNLINIQNKFQSYLMTSECAINSEIEETNKISADTRLDIYRNAYRLRLIDALASNYPVLQKYMGDDCFQELALLYIDSHPSQFRSIRWFGNQLENFLREHDKYAEFPLLAELSKLEWHMTLTFDAPDLELINIETVVQIPPDNWTMMRFIPHPSVYILSFQWNAIQIWQSLSQDNPPPEPIQYDVSIPYIFWRKNLINQYCSLPHDEHYAVDSMVKGLTFGEICEGLCQWVDEQEAALRAASLLKGWISSGLISAVEISQKEKFDENNG